MGYKVFEYLYNLDIDDEKGEPMHSGRFGIFSAFNK